jgi:hypothetical protein
MSQETACGSHENSQKQELLDADLATIESVVLRRLIEEVRQEASVPRSYNRIYNRHNR